PDASPSHRLDCIEWHEKPANGPESALPASPQKYTHRLDVPSGACRMKPFLKWAGGKYKIIDTILSALPAAERLVEPFVGSGAVFLNADYHSYLLADTNPDLIHLYRQVQREGANFVDQAAGLFVPSNNTEEAYYRLREEFNQCTNAPRRAALFVYLNRHCFNGLCRYNSKGKFNVPYGRYARPVFPTAEILNFHEKSQKAEFILADFRTTMASATLRDVVYCDPPYAPLTLTSNFSDYTQEGFNAADQSELALTALQLKQRGIPVVISNHDTDFTRSIYAEADISGFDVQRFISSKASQRGKAAELIAVFA
ncbi:MAG: Dam family site-specific DNA-(adenine-N6)-methyltransferase, partial [Giesbergeria sp.]|nr:Dam family site-specific DNA-(adenine-N6)-methyltransferase [Giesbergeria sp.]